MFAATRAPAAGLPLPLCMACALCLGPRPHLLACADSPPFPLPSPLPCPAPRWYPPPLARCCLFGPQGMTLKAMAALLPDLEEEAPQRGGEYGLEELADE